MASTRGEYLFVGSLPFINAMSTGPGPRLYAELASRRIGLEVMSTPAACRTYNILGAEGRRVSALMLVTASPTGC